MKLRARAPFVFLLSVGCSEELALSHVPPRMFEPDIVNVIDAGIGGPAADASFADATIADAAVEDAAVADAAENFPDAATCADRVDMTALDVGAASTNVFSGTESGAIDGTFVLRGPNGEELRGPVPVAGGAYSVEIPLFCGVQTVEFAFPVDACTTTLITTVTRSACAGVDVQVTLQWDTLGLDWELHLVKPGGRINDPATDCTWNTCIDASPDWGVPGDATDNPSKDIDNTGSQGLENIVLAHPEGGTYHILVEHWGEGDAQSDGAVTITTGGQSIVVPITDLPSHSVRFVAEVTFPGGVVTPLTGVHDCAGNWNRGCADQLP